MDKEKLSGLLDARKKFCSFCKEKDNDCCKDCKVTQLIKQAYEEMEKEQMR